MLKNYLKVALRNLTRYKGYSFINILGLAVGIACCLLILLFVQDELSYDRFNKNSDNIYRVVADGALGNTQFKAAVSAPPLGPTLVREYPEVIAYARIRNYGYPVIRYKEKVFSEEKFYWADSTFFKVFTGVFIKGDPNTALNKPESVVITDKMAKKYFGSEDPVGKSLNSDNRKDYKITGVVKEFPSNSHFHFDFLGSLSSYQDEYSQAWLDNNFSTYILLRSGTSPAEFNKKLKDIVRKYVSPYMQNFMNMSVEDLEKGGGRYNLFLQPLTDIHLHSHYIGELEPNSDIMYVYVFSFIAISILLIACINFTNLSTARSSNRSKEIGIRKTLGSSRPQLVKQFLAESTMMTFIAVILALILIEFALPSFNNLVGKNLTSDYSNIYTIPALVLFVLLVGALAGGYPALFLSSFDPVKVLKKRPGTKGKGFLLRNALVVVQFAVSITLFIGSFIVYSQLEYISNKKLGFNKDQVIVIQKTDDIGKFINSFREELNNIPGVLSASNSATLFGKQTGNNPYKRMGTNDNHLVSVIFADYNFADAYGIKMVSGRYYSKDWGTDSTAIVLNESAVKELGIEGDPIGQQITYSHSNNNANTNNGVAFNIIGVMKDFHFESLKQKIAPLIVRLFGPRDFGRFVSVKVTAGDIKNKLQNIKEAWHKFAGNQAFEYFFFDEDFAKQYEAEKRTGTIVTVFSLLAIFIACLGLLGLASFTTEQRTKEVGVRKILGASIPGIVLLLSKDFSKWVILANIIAWPVAYFVMNRWLQDFAYKIEISPWTFIISGITALLIAFVTVGYQALKAATANPVKSLKYE